MSLTFFIVIVAALAAVLVVAALAVFKNKSGSSDAKPATTDAYQLMESIFTPAERSFFGVLEQLDYESITVTAKVRLADVFEVKRGLERGARQTAQNRINSKHVDFLFLRKSDGRPVLGIELDDASHQRADRRARDEFVDHVFAAGKLPLVHIRAQATYNVQEIHSTLEKAMSAT